MAIRFSEQRRLAGVVHTKDTEQLPCMRALGHVADTEQHAFPRVFLVEGLAHPVKRSLVGALPPTAVEEHGVGFPIAIRAVVGARGIFELEAEIIGTGFERFQLLIEERPLARGLRIQSPFLRDLLWFLRLVEKSRVSRPDQRKRPATRLGFLDGGRHERAEKRRSILRRHAAVHGDAVFHHMAALRTTIAGRRPELEIDPVPALERSAVGKVSKSDWEQALEFTVGCYPGAADSFPVVGATLR